MRGALKLDHLQPFEPIFFRNVSISLTIILGAHFLLPQRANTRGWENSPSPKLDRTVGFQCLGHSNWAICSPLSPFCSEIFPSVWPSYWGTISYYPRGLILGFGRFLQLQNLIGLRGFSAWGIQTGPFAACWAHFVQKFLHQFHFNTGSPYLITPVG